MNGHNLNRKFSFLSEEKNVKTIKARTNPWFLIIIPPLGILFFLVERYFIAANRQVSSKKSMLVTSILATDVGDNFEMLVVD